jgi:lysozyme family protein
MNTNHLIAANSIRWKIGHVTPDLVLSIDRVAGQLIAAKPRYLAVSGPTGVPWHIIAVIHEREASQSWLANLANGDPWKHPTIHVPRGRGPFNSWEDAAIDALTNCAPHAADWDDWSAGGSLTLLEEFNGLGYFHMGRPSPYVWAATDQYHSGKYISDGHYDPNAIDHQIGCAALLIRMMAADQSIEVTP